MPKKKRKQKKRDTAPRKSPSSSPLVKKDKRFSWVWLLMILPLAGGVWSLVPKGGSGPHGREQNQGFQIVGKMPHDPQAYTQGLLYHEDFFYESTGLRGFSSLRKVDPDSGLVLRKIALEDRFFGEGLAFFKGLLYQLTWTSGEVLVYDLETFSEIRRHTYEGQGWGLTADRDSLIMSNGSATLTYRSPQDFSVLRSLPVLGDRVGQLNELEYINGEIWANTYISSDILRISPETGRVLGRLDLKELPRPEERNGAEDVLNGIAFDPFKQRIFVTGKRYSFIYEIQLETNGR